MSAVLSLRRPPQNRPLGRRAGRVIAEFMSARDAKLFASIKRDEGQDVTVMPSQLPQFLVCVRLLEPAL